MEDRATARIAGLSLGGIFLACMMLAAFGASQAQSAGLSSLENRQLQVSAS